MVINLLVLKWEKEFKRSQEIILIIRGYGFIPDISQIPQNYLASSEMAKPPPRASLIFKTSPFFTVLWMIW